jgi:hypothetical protein
MQDTYHYRDLDASTEDTPEWYVTRSAAGSRFDCAYQLRRDRPVANGKVSLGDVRRALGGVQASRMHASLLCLVVVLPISVDRLCISRHVCGPRA